MPRHMDPLDPRNDPLVPPHSQKDRYGRPILPSQSIDDGGGGGSGSDLVEMIDFLPDSMRELAREATEYGGIGGAVGDVLGASFGTFQYWLRVPFFFLPGKYTKYAAAGITSVIFAPPLALMYAFYGTHQLNNYSRTQTLKKGLAGKDITSAKGINKEEMFEYAHTDRNIKTPTWDRNLRLELLDNLEFSYTSVEVGDHGEIIIPSSVAASTKTVIGIKDFRTQIISATVREAAVKNQSQAKGALDWLNKDYAERASAIALPPPAVPTDPRTTYLADASKKLDQKGFFKKTAAPAGPGAAPAAPTPEPSMDSANLAKIAEHITPEDLAPGKSVLAALQEGLKKAKAKAAATDPISEIELVDPLSDSSKSLIEGLRDELTDLALLNRVALAADPTDASKTAEQQALEQRQLDAAIDKAKKHFQPKLDTAQDLIESADKGVIDLKSRIKNLLFAQRKIREAANEMVKGAKDSYKRWREEISEAQALINKADGALNTAKNELVTMQTSLSDMKTKLAEVKASISDYNAKFGAAAVPRLGGGPGGPAPTIEESDKNNADLDLETDLTAQIAAIEGPPTDLMAQKKLEIDGLEKQLIEIKKEKEPQIKAKENLIELAKAAAKENFDLLKRLSKQANKQEQILRAHYAELTGRTFTPNPKTTIRANDIDMQLMGDDNFSAWQRFQHNYFGINVSAPKTHTEMAGLQNLQRWRFESCFAYSEERDKEGKVIPKVFSVGLKGNNPPRSTEEALAQSETLMALALTKGVPKAIASNGNPGQVDRYEMKSKTGYTSADVNDALATAETNRGAASVEKLERTLAQQAQFKLLLEDGLGLSFVPDPVFANNGLTQMKAEATRRAEKRINQQIDKNFPGLAGKSYSTLTSLEKMIVAADMMKLSETDARKYMEPKMIKAGIKLSFEEVMDMAEGYRKDPKAAAASPSRPVILRGGHP